MDATPIKPPMTKAEVENWILLQAQTGKRWFKIEILDDEVGQDTTMIALMETVSDMIFAGICDMPFQEAEAARKKKHNKIATGVRMAIVKPNGDAA